MNSIDRFAEANSGPRMSVQGKRQVSQDYLLLQHCSAVRLVLARVNLRDCQCPRWAVKLSTNWRIERAAQRRGNPSAGDFKVT